jgi:hypothetical protein
MTKRAISAESYLEEIAKAEHELLQMQHELLDAQKFNDDLSKRIDKKVGSE